MNNSNAKPVVNPYALQTAQISWSDNGVPHADDYGDVYFSRDNGLEESRYVFLQHNHLAERWAALPKEQPGHFTILETGFGSGLNFLLSWQLWQKLAPPSWRLQYISLEKHPMQAEDLQLAHQHWADLKGLANALQKIYPARLPGHHRRWLNTADKRSAVCLDLVFGDLHQTLPELLDGDWAVARDRQSQTSSDYPLLNRPKIDAWFLDGFAPAQNPDMWQEPLFSCMDILSAAGTTFATFTSAGVVKRGLRSAGFKVQKVKGYGRKREMLCGYWQQHREEDSLAQNPASALSETEPRPEPTSEPRCEQLCPPSLPWHQPSSYGTVQHIAVIGAGLAGCSTAAALAQRGYRVSVFERHASPATEASGNPQGILYTKLSPDPGALNHFTLSSYLYALNYYRLALQDHRPPIGELCGVLQLANTPRDEQNFKLLAEMLANQDWLTYFSAGAKTELAPLGVPAEVTAAAHFFPDAGWLNPASLCDYYLRHPNITLHTETAALTLSQSEEKWQIITQQRRYQADAVVVANANDALSFSQTNFLPLRAIRGQLSYIPESTLSQPLKTVICHEGYIAPAQHGQYCIGASFGTKTQAGGRESGG